MTKRPNIILILADDMGFSDLGCTGSEIRTPHIDSMAKNGALMSAMYNCARCCPTRASLLTGLYPHKAGIGHMGTNLGTPAYQGFLRNDSVTIAEVLKGAGYRTLMSGKWHVGGDFLARDYDDWRPGEVDHPTARQRGFDRFYGLHDGATHFFSPPFVMEDDTRIEVPPSDYYFTDAITDRALDMVDDAVAGDQPFFLYLAHAAPHWPLHAHEEDIARYDGVYGKGWDEIRTARHETMLGADVLRHHWDISPRDDGARPWESVENLDWEAARMAVYAAMVDRMDQQIGRVLAHLKARGVHDDTLILFLSDNGGCAEFMAEDGWAQYYPDRHLDGRQIHKGNRPDLRPGSPYTFMSYDLPWANVSNAPFRLFKHWVHEGGISTPLVVQWPNGFRPRGTIHDAWHVIDVLPTILDAAGATYPSDYGGHPVQPLDGQSFLATLMGQDAPRGTPIFWEHEGNSAIRLGNFKLVRQHGRDWELYDMDADRTELHDLAGQNTPLEGRLKRAYDDWADKAGVIGWDRLQPLLLQAWGLKTTEG
jgi:arylsulfatase A-like enzyme